MGHSARRTLLAAWLVRQPRAQRPEGQRVLRAPGRVELQVALAVAVAFTLLFGLAPLAAPDVRAAGPRVAIIVGPVGSLTDLYRADAQRAAAEARRYTDDVVTVYSPNATWSAALAAMRGASLVVYLGHGNGWPSRYSSALNPRTQDGLGLNPVAGVDDVAHQYFGEAYLARSVELAPNAVVILSHLCYASGNSEPGLPEGSLAVAKQRVDNFAAGFLAAGAGAVLTDAFQAPAHYVRAILTGGGTIERIWRAAPSSHDHVLAFPSARTPGFTALMDPTNQRSGFYRSLVTRADLRAAEVARGGTARAGDPVGGGAGPEMPPGGWQVVGPPEPAVAPDAFDLGARPGTPTLTGVTLAASTVQLQLPVELPAGVALGSAFRLGTRWIPLDEGSAPADPAQGTDSAQGADPAQGAEPGPASSADPTQAEPPASPDPAASPGPADPAPAASSTPGPPTDLDQAPSAAAPVAPAEPALGVNPVPASGADPAPGAESSALVARESAASLVEVVPASVIGSDVAGLVTLPAASGRYRLEVTLHDADGVALPYAVQVAIPGVVVHIGGPGAAWLDAPPTLAVVAGTLTSVQVGATNGEPAAWAGCGPGLPAVGPAAAACGAVLLVGRWVALAGSGGAAPMTRELNVPAASAQATWLSGPVPTEPGTYLLVLSLERATGAGGPQVLGRPTTVTVVVAAEELLPAPTDDAAAPLLPTPGGAAAPLLPPGGGASAPLLPPQGASSAPQLPSGGADPALAPIGGSLLPGHPTTAARRSPADRATAGPDRR